MTRRCFVPICVAALMLGSWSASTRAGTVPTIAAFAIGPEATALRIDGELNEAVWEKAPVVKGFIQRMPSEGAAASHDTEVRIAYDATSLYVAVNAIDAQPDQIVGILTRRDDTSPSDWVSIHVDSFHDRRSAYEFGVNASGVKYDRYWFNDSNNDRGWDAVWAVAVTRHAGGWRLAGGVQDSLLATAVQPHDGRRLRICGGAHDCPIE